MQMGQYQKYLHALYLEGQKRGVPNISPHNAAFIVNILEQYQVKQMLEVGCANGYSTLHWAYYLKNSQKAKDQTQTLSSSTKCELPCNHMLHTIDLSFPMFSEAFTHLKECKLHLNVCGYLGDALNILPMFQPALFDAIFIDAQKKNTKDFVQLSLPLLKENGIIIIDDVMKFADKMNIEGIICCIDAFNAISNQNNQCYTHHIVPTDIDDAIMLITNHSYLAPF